MNAVPSPVCPSLGISKLATFMFQASGQVLVQRIKPFYSRGGGDIVGEGRLESGLGFGCLRKLWKLTLRLMEDPEKGKYRSLNSSGRDFQAGMHLISNTIVRRSYETTEVVAIENCKDQIHSQQPKYYPFSNENENMTYHNLWYASKTVLKGKLIALIAFTRNERSQSSKISLKEI